jgi:hypothetical protein
MQVRGEVIRIALYDRPENVKRFTASVLVNQGIR